MFPAALAGRTATVLGDPDQPHTYTYIPDIGEGLAVLGEHPHAPGQVWHLPNVPHTDTTRQLVELIYHHAGQQRSKLPVLPARGMSALAVVNPTVRELLEMTYQFEERFIVDSHRITDRLGLTATPVDRTLTATLDHYRHRSGSGRTPS